MIRWLRRPPGMSCHEVADLLQHHLDHELDRTVNHRVTVHLEKCDRCALEYTVYREIKAVLVRRGQAPLDPAVVEGLQRFCDGLRRGEIDPGGVDDTPPSSW